MHDLNRALGKAQGYATTAVLKQDNKVVETLAINGRRRQCLQNLHIYFFYVTNQVAQRRMKVRHCLTKEMLTDANLRVSSILVKP